MGMLTIAVAVFWHVVVECTPPAWVPSSITPTGESSEATTEDSLRKMSDSQSYVPSAHVQHGPVWVALLVLEHESVDARCDVLIGALTG